jgi:hypothetical protein
MKSETSFTANCTKVLLASALCFLGSTAMAQQSIASNVEKAHKTALSDASLSGATNKAEVKLDTVECLFHQLVNDKRPLLTWRKGYVVLEDDKILVGNQDYPKSQASYITGMIKNQFLWANRKKAVTKKVVQLVLLQ